MEETNIIIKVKTPKKLDVNEIYEVMSDFKARMEGLVTDVPKSLESAELSVGDYIQDGETLNILDEVKKLRNDSDNN